MCVTCTITCRVCMRVCVCTNVLVYVHACLCVHTCASVWLCTCVHACMSVGVNSLCMCMLTCMYKHVCYIFACVCVPTLLCMCVRVCALTEAGGERGDGTSVVRCPCPGNTPLRCLEASSVRVLGSEPKEEPRGVAGFQDPGNVLGGSWAGAGASGGARKRAALLGQHGSEFCPPSPCASWSDDWCLLRYHLSW